MDNETQLNPQSRDSNYNKNPFRILRLIGYGLILLSIIDIIHILVPPQFMNPFWELQIIGTLIERVPVPLLGFALVFAGDYHDRRILEEILLKILSWLALLSALFFLLAIPLCTIDTFRVNTISRSQLDAQLQQRLLQLKQVSDQVKQNQSINLESLAEQLKNSGISIDSQNPEAIKNELISRVKNSREQLKQQAQATRTAQQRTLVKNLVKWNLGALVASVLFFYVWKTTDWARSFR